MLTPFEFDQAHGVAFQGNQLPEHGFLEEAVHETPNVASGFWGHRQFSEPFLDWIRFDLPEQASTPLRRDVLVDTI